MKDEPSGSRTSYGASGVGGVGEEVTGYRDYGTTGGVGATGIHNDVTGTHRGVIHDWPPHTTSHRQGDNVRWEYFDEAAYVKGDGGVAEGEDAYAKNQVST